jgi:hypothetical protein
VLAESSWVAELVSVLVLVLVASSWVAELDSVQVLAAAVQLVADWADELAEAVALVSVSVAADVACSKVAVLVADEAVAVATKLGNLDLVEVTS